MALIVGAVAKTDCNLVFYL